MCLYELQDWPRFRWSSERVGALLAEVRHRQGRLVGRMEALGFGLRQEAVLQTLTADVTQSTAIEGERLDAQQVRSSIARRLGMDIGGLVAADRQVDGVVEMMLDATRHYDKALDERRLFAWHAALFPTGRSGMAKIDVAAWRADAKGPMQVVSGPIGRERVHFEAVPAPRVASEMSAFLEWWSGGPEIDAVLRAALAHLWFVTVHPFEDGNGRIARALADMALARSENSSQRFYSMSAEIRRERDVYHRKGATRFPKSAERRRPGLWTGHSRSSKCWCFSCLRRRSAGTSRRGASRRARGHEGGRSTGYALVQEWE